MWTLLWWKRYEYLLINTSYRKAKRKFYKHFHHTIKKKGPHNYIEFLSKPNLLPSLVVIKGEWEIYNYKKESS